MKALNQIKKVVIIGGSASGAAAAARIRRFSEDTQITVIEKTNHPSYSSCGMPYYLGGEIPQRNSLLITPIPMLQKGYKFNMLVETEAIKIDLNKKKVISVNKKTGKEVIQEYDKLILAMGGKPTIPSITNISKKEIAHHVFTLNNLQEMDILNQRISKTLSSGAIGSIKPHVMVLGGGFIGLETAEQIRKKSNNAKKEIDVSIIEMGSHLMPPIDKDMATIVQREMIKNKVGVQIQSTITQIDLNDESDKDILPLVVSIKNVANPKASLKKVKISFLVLAAGVSPSSALAAQSGIQLSPKGHVLVSENMQTNDPDVYATGDLVICKDKTGNLTYTPLANLAALHGRLAASHMFGATPDERNPHVGVGVVSIFGKTVVSVGSSEERLKLMNKNFKEDYLKVLGTFSHRSGYMPSDASPFNITAKLIFDAKSGKINGLQAIGEKGLESLGNIFALAMKYDGTVKDLEDAEFLYCPYYGSPRNVSNQLSMMAQGVLRGTHKFTFYDMLKDDEILIDVRPPEAYQTGQIRDFNCINIPLPMLREKLKGLDKSKKYVTTCTTGKTAYFAQRILELSGFENVKTLAGGFTGVSRTNDLNKKKN